MQYLTKPYKEKKQFKKGERHELYIHEINSPRVVHPYRSSIDTAHELHSSRAMLTRNLTSSRIGIRSIRSTS